MEVIKGRSVFTEKNIRLNIDKDIIISVEELKSSEQLPYISPGFLDTQVNGYAGLDYSSKNLKPSDVIKITDRLAASGTSRHFPTIVTNSQELIINNLTTIAQTIANYPEISAAIPGIHIEGPYISSEDGPRGAHNSRFIRKPDYKEFLEWQEAAEGRIRQITLAPELTGALDYIKQVSSEGVVIAIGHTASSPEIIREAVKAGASMSTHLGNGSHGMVPRLENYIWEQLASDNLTASIITDGFHLPSAVVKVILKTKGLNGLVLVSDVAVLGGMEPGVHKWGEIDVEVFEDGHLGLAGTEYLAGSGHLFDHSLAWFMNKLNLTPCEVVPLCTSNPQRMFFTREPVQKLNSGDTANLTLFNWEKGDSKFKILGTWCQGKKVY